MDSREAFSPENLPPQDPIKHEGNGWLFLIVAFVLIALLLGLVWLIHQTHKVFVQGGDSTTPMQCDTEVQGLEAPPTLCCTVTAGSSPRDRYDDHLKLIISPADPVPYGTVCSEFCSTGATYNPKNETCSNFDTEADRLYFTNCIAATKPRSCLGVAMPVAVDASGTPYYAQRASLSGCLTTTCPSS